MEGDNDRMDIGIKLLLSEESNPCIHKDARNLAPVMQIVG